MQRLHDALSIILSLLLLVPYTLAQGNTSDSGNNSIQFKHFTAHDDSQTCTADSHSRPFNNQIRGVNLGGWMVLEPWITPSLFYQFLGKDETTTAVDIYSFCKVLGPEEGNRQLRRHWDTWVTEDIIRELADSGAVNSLRLPVGDFMYKPYGPYVGCTDGALEYVDDLLDWALSYGLTVLIDIHAVKGSQNGFDNSGQAQGFEWTTLLNTYPAGDVTFEHWPVRSAAWMGTFDPTTASYSNINYDNIQHALDVIELIANKYKAHPAVLGLEPVNEPWQYTPIEHLKDFYWKGYLIVKKHAPYWKYIMHDSFRLDTSIWGGFMAGCPDRALDTHIYQAWKDPSSREMFYTDACANKNIISDMESAFGPVIVGEWSLATDNCAMWLNGFNDNLPGFPRLPCKYIPCAAPYMGPDQPGTPVDPGKPAQGPFGTGMSGPIFGLCPVGRDWLKESSGLDSGKDWMKAPPQAPRGKDASNVVMKNLALKKINSYSGFGHGFYFWNFRTDLDEPHWSYMLALERGWIPNGNLNDVAITNACHKEDNGLYRCVAKRNQLESNIRDGIDYIISSQGNNTDLVSGDGSLNTTSVANMTGDELYELADRAYNEYWKEHRVEGATCDYGGTGQLVESNYTYTDSDDDFEDDDQIVFWSSPRILQLVGVIFGSIVLGGMVGFCTVMRLNKKFNQRMTNSKLGRSFARNKFAKSFAGFSDYEAIPDHRWKVTN